MINMQNCFQDIRVSIAGGEAIGCLFVLLVISDRLLSVQ